MTENYLAAIDDMLDSFERFDPDGIRRYPYLDQLQDWNPCLGLATFDDFAPETLEQYKAIATVMRFTRSDWKTKWLILSGRPGTGKTHLMTAAAIEIASRHGAEFRTVVAADMLSAITRTYRDNSISFEDVLEGFCTGLLAIDDLEIGTPGYELEAGLLERILITRYHRNLGTILGTNLDPEQLTYFLGERVADCIRECAYAIVPFDWDSYRRSGKPRYRLMQDRMKQRIAGRATNGC